MLCILSSTLIATVCKMDCMTDNLNNPIQQACRSVLIKNMIEGAWCCLSCLLAYPAAAPRRRMLECAMHPLRPLRTAGSRGDEGEQGTRDGDEAGTLWNHGNCTDTLLFALLRPLRACRGHACYLSNAYLICRHWRDR